MSVVIDEKRIRTLVEEKFASLPLKTQVAIAVIDNGELSFHGFIKEQVIEAVSNEERVFDIGSIGKVFTATVLADLVMNEGLDIDAQLSSFYDFSFAEKLDVTLIDLANHTSGFKSRKTDFEVNEQNLKNYYETFDEEAMIKSLKKLSLYDKSNKGTYSYSNYGFGLLGYTLSGILGIDFREVLKERVFARFGMVNTVTHSGNASNLVTGLDEEGNETVNWNMDVLIGAGGQFSTVKDLSKFLLAHFDESNKELSLTRKPTHTVDDGMKVGLGLHIVKGSKDYDVYWHNGASGGYKSAMEFNIETKSGVIVLSNVSFFNENHWDIDRICTTLMNELIEKNTA